MQPCPDGASDGDPPQELDRPRDGDRPPARRARPDRVHAGGARRQPPGAAPQRAHPVADQPGARHAPARHRRGRQRPVLLRLHLPARAAAVLCRSRAPARRHRPGLAGRQGSVLPAHGKLDRRRPRRQSLRHRRGDAPDARHAERARLRFYLEELHQLGGELSLDGRIVRVSDGLRGAGRRARPTAPSSARTNPIGAPSSACMRGSPPPPGRSTSWKRRIRRSGRRRPTTRWTTSRPISTPSSTRCRRTASAPLARGRLRALRRAVDVFGFHLASLDLRQNSDVHERVVAELVEAAGLGDYRALDEPGRVALLVRELGNMRPLSSPHLSYGEETANELAMLDVAADAHRRYGPRSMPQLRDLQGRQRLGHPGSGRAAQGGRPAAPARGPARRRHRAAVRDHRRPAALRADHGSAVRPAGLPPPARLARQRAGGDAGLFRQQQGRRLPHLDLGALQGRADAGRAVPPP